MHLDTTKLRKFGDNLIRINRISFPKIMNTVINTAVYDSSNTLKKEIIPKTFTKRNNFAPMSIRYNRAIGYNMNTMFGMVGQIQNAGQNNTKTMLEENELGKSIDSKTKHTTLGLSNIRTGNTFSKTIKKENRLTNLNPIPAQHILRTFRFTNETDNNKQQLEFKRIAGLMASNRIKTLNKPIIIHTQNNGIGIYRIKNTGDKNNRLSIEKLYKLNSKTTRIRKREWLRPTQQKLLNNMDRIYAKTAKEILNRNAKAFNISIGG